MEVKKDDVLNESITPGTFMYYVKVDGTAVPGGNFVGIRQSGKKTFLLFNTDEGSKWKVNIDNIDKLYTKKASKSGTKASKSHDSTTQLVDKPVKKHTNQNLDFDKVEFDLLKSEVTTLKKALHELQGKHDELERKTKELTKVMVDYIETRPDK